MAVFQKRKPPVTKICFIPVVPSAGGFGHAQDRAVGAGIPEFIPGSDSVQAVTWNFHKGCIRGGTEELEGGVMELGMMQVEAALAPQIASDFCVRFHMTSSVLDHCHSGTVLLIVYAPAYMDPFWFNTQHLTTPLQSQGCAAARGPRHPWAFSLGPCTCPRPLPPVPPSVRGSWHGGQRLRTCLCLQVDADIALRYQKVMAEWKACEVIVKQREKESHSATLAKFSSGSSIDSHVQRLIHRDSTISNDVGTPFPLTIWSGQPQEAQVEVSTAPESWAETGAVVSLC